MPRAMKTFTKVFKVSIDISAGILSSKRHTAVRVHTFAVARTAAAICAAAFLLFACTTVEPATEPEIDKYAAFRESRPRSILIMPPINQSFDLQADEAFLATAARPLAEAGYYVIPTALSTETFRQNGVIAAEEAHAIPPARLREIFGADSALYITISRFGVQYAVLDSVVTAAASAKLVDLRTGMEIWSGAGAAGQNNNSGVYVSGGENLLGMVIGAAIQQAINTASYDPYDLGRRANVDLLSAGKRDGILYGPYHSAYGTE